MASESYGDGATEGGETSNRKGAPKTKPSRPRTPNPKAANVRKLWEEGTKSVRPEIQEYWLNYSFLEGNQWVVWSADSNRLENLPRYDPDKARITVNRMAANTRTIISKAMQRHMVFEVYPDAADDAHVRAARLSETIARTVHREHQWEIKRERLYQAVWKGGTAAVCVDWDPHAKDQILPQTSDGKPPVYQGDSVESVVSIGEFIVEPGARDPERGRYWIRGTVAPPKEVQATHQLDWEPSADGFTAQQPYVNRFVGGTPGEQDVTLVLTYYERPNYLNKKGSICVVVNDQVVHEADWPFPVTDRLNLFVARETVVENRWTGTTILSSARPIQTALNASWTQIIEHMKKAGNARLYVPNNLDVDSLTDEAGEVVQFDPLGGRPEWGSPPTMPDWWIREPELLQEQLDDVMGVHEVSRGEAPSNIESGYGISILVEQDTTPVGRLVKETVRVFSDAMSFVLKLYEQEATTKRKTSIAEPGMPPMSLEWTGKDLMGQTTAQIPEDTILPRSRAAQMKAAESMMQMGLIQSLADFAFVAELPDARGLLDATSPDISRARRENAVFAAGRASVVEDFDDHEAHIAEHNRFRKSVTYETMEDEWKQQLATHIQAHETSAAEELGRRRAGTMIDPALGMAPTASGAPTMEALPPEAPPDPEMMAMEQVGGMSDDIIAALAGEGGVPAEGEAPPA